MNNLMIVASVFVAFFIIAFVCDRVNVMIRKHNQKKRHERHKRTFCSVSADGSYFVVGRR